MYALVKRKDVDGPKEIVYLSRDEAELRLYESIYDALDHYQYYSVEELILNEETNKWQFKNDR